MLVQTHVPKHHHTGEQKCSRIRLSLASNIRCSTMNCFKNGRTITNVGRGSESQPTDEASTQITDDVTVQVGQYHHVQQRRILGQQKTGIIKGYFVVLNHRETGSSFVTRLQEESVTHFHNVRLVNSSHTIALLSHSVLKGVFGHSQRSLLGDQLDTLSHTRLDNVFNATVLTFGVLTYNYDVHIVVAKIQVRNTASRTNICKKVEGLAQGQVQRNMAFADRGAKRTFETKASLQKRGVYLGGEQLSRTRCYTFRKGNIHRIPCHRHFGRLKNLDDSF
mmetsp:Transcript_4592/g.14036  ORF Transcript_4592/g.14036 Transcript_4592/m.14036 type:complete len:278 (+) Transcript_4592:145-978(+)